MSTKTVAGGLLTVELSDVVMVTYNPGYTEERAVIERAHALGKGVLIKKALSSGHLEKTVDETMRFVFAEPGVTSVIVGTLNAQHLAENVRAVELCLD